jgi:MFS family permease
MGSQSKYGANFLNATKLGAIFLILNIPFMTVQNLLSELQKNNGFGALGFWLLAVFYLFQMLGSVISAAVFDKIGMKSTFFLGGIFLSLVVLC